MEVGREIRVEDLDGARASRQKMCRAIDRTEATRRDARVEPESIVERRPDERVAPIDLGLLAQVDRKVAHRRICIRVKEPFVFTARSRYEITALSRIFEWEAEAVERRSDAMVGET